MPHAAKESEDEGRVPAICASLTASGDAWPGRSGQRLRLGDKEESGVAPMLRLRMRGGLRGGGEWGMGHDAVGYRMKEVGIKGSISMGRERHRESG